jgi:hypothetical protein
MSKHEAKTASFPDGTEFDLGANYDAQTTGNVQDPDPAMRYYLAADDGNNGRPDGVRSVQNMGYRKSEKKHDSPDLVLMEIPRHVWDARQEAKQERAQRLKKQALNAPEGLKAQPEHGAYSKRK